MFIGFFGTVKKQNVYNMNNVKNPYNGVDPNRQLSKWNRFTDWLGITNNSGKAQYQHDIYANQWDSNIALSYEDREYNSFANQANEMREAGINPDFANVAGGMSELAKSQPNQAVPQYTEELAFGNFLSTAFNSALQIASGIANINNLNFGQDLSILSSSFDSAKTGFVGKISDSLFSKNSEYDDLIEFINKPTFSNHVLDLLNESSAYKGFHNNFKTKRGKKIFDRFFDDYINSDKMRQDMLDSIMASNKKSVGASSSLGEVAALKANDPNAQMTEVSKILAKYQFKYLENTLKLNKSKSAKDLKYVENFNADEAVRAANNANTESADASKADNDFKALERGIINDLKKASDNGNMLATGLLGIMVIASKFSVQGSANSRVGVNTSTGELFDNSSRGISFGF